MSVPVFSQVTSTPALFWVDGWTLVLSVILCCIVEVLVLVVRLVASRTPAKVKELQRIEALLKEQVKMTNYPEMFVKNSKFKRYDKSCIVHCCEYRVVRMGDLRLNHLS